MEMPSGSSLSSSECGDLGRRGRHLLGLGSCFLSVLCPLGVGGLQRVRTLSFSAIGCPVPLWPLARVPQHHQLVSGMPWSLGWTTSAQPGEAAVPSWSLMSFQELLTEALLATFASVGGGGGVQTLEDTGLRCVMNGTLVWVEMAALKSQCVLPTEK